MHSHHGFAAGALESADGVDASAGVGASAVTAGRAIGANVGTNDDSLDEFESGAEFTAFGGAVAGTLLGHSTSHARRMPT